MAKKLFVGNLDWSIDDARLEEIFSEYGQVSDAKVIMHPDSDKSRGFGFVTLVNDGDADTARSELNGQEVEGRELRIDIADRQPESSAPDASAPAPTATPHADDSNTEDVKDLDTDEAQAIGAEDGPNPFGSEK